MVAVVTTLLLTIVFSLSRALIQTKQHYLSSLSAAGGGDRLQTRPSQQQQRTDIQYPIEEETPSGKQIGRGLRFDAGFEDKYSDIILNSIHFRFLNEPPDFIKFTDDIFGILTTVGRIDREQLCPSRQAMSETATGGNSSPQQQQQQQQQQQYSAWTDALCRIKLDVVVQPMQYFEIIKVTLLIVDVNDHVPAFPSAVSSNIALSILESAAVGTEYHLPAAVDLDSIQYSVQRYTLSPQYSEFQLRTDRKYDGTVDLKLVLNRAVDRESRESYQLILTAYDGGVPSLTGSCTVNIVIVDANDNRPTFQQASYEATIVENIPVGSTILRVSAVDPDEGDNGAVKYLLSAASSAHYGHVFTVDNASGDVIVIGAVDFERTSVYHLVVCAVDSGTELTTSSDVVVVIKVGDVNDNAPVITVNTLTGSATDTASVSEDSTPGTFVGHVIVTDLDDGRNGRTNCTIVRHGTDAETVFRLEHMFETEYKLVTASLLDREKIAHYVIQLNCTDHGKPARSTVLRLTVNVDDVNDNTPKFVTSQYSVELLENHYLGATVVQVSATDADIDVNAAIRYVIVDALSAHDTPRDEDGDRVALDGEWKTFKGQGREKIRNKPSDSSRQNKKQRPRTESGGKSSESPRRRERADESGRQRPLYVEGKDCWDNFNVNSITGLITTRAMFDYESVTTFKCRILAIDGGSQPKTGEAELIVTIVDVNDERPTFQQAEYTFHLLEHSPVGSFVGTVSALDRDQDPYNMFSLSVRPLGPASSATVEEFSIDRLTGVITANKPLDREQQSKYAFLAVASDVHDALTLTSTAVVTVYIDDINDNTPVIVRPSTAQIQHMSLFDTCQSVSNDVTDDVSHLHRWSRVAVIFVSYKAPIGTNITQIQAVDSDAGDNARITFLIDSVINQHTLNLFTINQQGTILLNSALTARDINTTHHVTVTASDAGTQPLSSTIDLCINIADYQQLQRLDDQPKITAKHGGRLIEQLVLTRSVLVIISLLSIMATVLVLFIALCIVRRVISRRRRLGNFRRPDYKGNSPEQYSTSCHMPNSSANACMDCKQIGEHCVLNASPRGGCYHDNATSQPSRAVIQSLESSPRRQLPLSHTGGSDVTGRQLKQIPLQQHHRYQTLPCRNKSGNADVKNSRNSTSPTPVASNVHSNRSRSDDNVV